MAPDRTDIEEHELPAIEAVLAGTLALMTGYSQSLQAALDPGTRLRMGEKIGANLALLRDHPALSGNFRMMLCGLCRRWDQIGACTRETCPAVAASEDAREHPATPTARTERASALQLPAPRRLQ